MLDLSCLMSVASSALLILALVMLFMTSYRTLARRAAIVSAFAFLCSAGIFTHFSDLTTRHLAGDAPSSMAQESGPGRTSLKVSSPQL